MVNWSGKEETLLYHFTPKVTIFQGLLVTGLRRTPKPASTKKVDRLQAHPAAPEGDRLTSGHKASGHGGNRAPKRQGDPEVKPAAVLTFRPPRYPELEGQHLNQRGVPGRVIPATLRPNCSNPTQPSRLRRWEMKGARETRVSKKPSGGVVYLHQTAVILPLYAPSRILLYRSYIGTLRIEIESSRKIGNFPAVTLTWGENCPEVSRFPTQTEATGAGPRTADTRSGV